MNRDNIVPGNEQKSEIDWIEVHRRIEKTREVLEQGALPSLEETRSILKKRAFALAQEPKKDESTQNYLEIVEFRLSQEIYGIESAFVREVYPLKDLTTLPCTPSFVLGIINVRGQILSVIDLKNYFNLPEKGLGNLNKVIILHSYSMEFGILADTILGTYSIPLESIQTLPHTVTGIGAEYLKGVTEGGVIILDAAKVLGDEKMIVHQEV
jgi:purine-binding chemotaxis protein CheW